MISAISYERVHRSAGLLGYTPSITHLELTSNALCEGDDVEGIAALAQAIASCGFLETLNLERVQMGDTGGDLLGKAIAANASLKKVDLQSCGIGEAAVTAILEAVEAACPGRVEGGFKLVLDQKGAGAAAAQHAEDTINAMLR